MGGSVDVKSELNKGTTFVVNIKSKSNFEGEVDKCLKGSSEQFTFIHKKHESIQLDSCMNDTIKENLNKQNQENEIKYSGFTSPINFKEKTLSDDSQNLSDQSDE